MNFKHQIFVRLRSSTHGRGPCYGGTATASVKITWPSGYNYRQSGTHTHTHTYTRVNTRIFRRPHCSFGNGRGTVRPNTNNRIEFIFNDLYWYFYSFFLLLPFSFHPCGEPQRRARYYVANILPDFRDSRIRAVMRNFEIVRKSYYG